MYVWVFQVGLFQVQNGLFLEYYFDVFGVQDGCCIGLYMVGVVSGV